MKYEVISCCFDGVQSIACSTARFARRCYHPSFFKSVCRVEASHEKQGKLTCDRGVGQIFTRDGLGNAHQLFVRMHNADNSGPEKSRMLVVWPPCRGKISLCWITIRASMISLSKLYMTPFSAFLSLHFDSTWQIETVEDSFHLCFWNNLVWVLVAFWISLRPGSLAIPYTFAQHKHSVFGEAIFDGGLNGLNYW